MCTVMNTSAAPNCRQRSAVAALAGQLPPSLLRNTAMSLCIFLTPYEADDLSGYKGGY